VKVKRIKKNDTVVVIKGEDRGKTGRVLEVLPSKGTAVVEGLNLVKKCVKRTQDTPGGGITDQEAPIALSNLMPYDPNAKKGARVGYRKQDNRVERCSKASAHVFE
jgi:large subunit ribosomal protein L24